VETTLHYIQFSEIGVTVAVIVAAMTFVVLTWNAVRAIIDWRTLAKKPTDDRITDHEQRIAALEGCCGEVRGKLKADWDFQNDEKDFNLIMLEAVSQLMKHALDGNDTNGLREVDEKIDKYLREKSQR
jgi:hypothetical protein